MWKYIHRKLHGCLVDDGSLLLLSLLLLFYGQWKGKFLFFLSLLFSHGSSAFEVSEAYVQSNSSRTRCWGQFSRHSWIELLCYYSLEEWVWSFMLSQFQKWCHWLSRIVWIIPTKTIYSLIKSLTYFKGFCMPLFDICRNVISLLILVIDNKILFF